MICRNCGQQIAEESEFCRFCGAKTNRVQQPGIVCPRCGMMSKPGTVFCGNCGCDLRGAGNESGASSYAVSRPKNNNTLIIAIIIIVVAIVLVAGVILTVTLTGRGGVRVHEPAGEVSISETATPEPTAEPTAEPTPEVTIPPQDNYGDYLFPSDTRYITYADLYGRTKEEVAFLRNEIYARHGYIFQNEKYISYFSSKSWYYPNPYFNESMFSDIERANKSTIVEYEKMMGWR